MEQSNHITCTVATANGFAMSFRPSASSARPDKKPKDARTSVPKRPAEVDASLRRES
jgi:hypothetical protein